MELFPERLVADLSRLPGAGHCYLKQLCAPDGTEVREALQGRVDALPAELQERAAEMLSSLDNRRFFQGFSEVAALAALDGAGWSPEGLVAPGPRIGLHRGDRRMLLSVLAFLHQTRPGGEEETRQRLVDALSRVSARLRFVVLIRRWLPHDFDPEPVRRAIELWLGQVGSGQWKDRYASYEDAHIALEFCLTGEKAKGRQSPVAMVLGPFYAHRTMEVLEPRVVTELDRHRASAARQEPVLVACVADQPWAVNEGYLRDFLYGRPRRTSSDETGCQVEYGGPAGVCLFRDPLYRGVTGLVLVDRRPHLPLKLRLRAWLNPWAERPLSPADLGLRCFAEDPVASAAATDDARVMRWHDGVTATELGCSRT